MPIICCWAEVSETQLTGPDMISETTEKKVQIRDRLRINKSRQKSIHETIKKIKQVKNQLQTTSDG